MTSQTVDGRSAVFHTNTNTQTHSTSDRVNISATPPSPSTHPTVSLRKSSCTFLLQQHNWRVPPDSSTTTAPGFHPRPRRDSDTSGCTQLAVKVKGVGGALGEGVGRGEGGDLHPCHVDCGRCRDLDSGDTRAHAHAPPVCYPLMCDRPRLLTLGRLR